MINNQLTYNRIRRSSALASKLVDQEFKIIIINMFKRTQGYGKRKKEDEKNNKIHSNNRIYENKPTKNPRT